MPFADQGGRIAGVVQIIGQRALIQGQAQRRRVACVGIELVAEAGLVAPGEQSGPRGAAIGGRDIAVGAADAGSGQGVDMGRRHQLAAVDANVAVAQVIGDDHQDVRLFGGRRQASGDTNKPEDGQGVFHRGGGVQ